MKDSNELPLTRYRYRKAQITPVSMLLHDSMYTTHLTHPYSVVSVYCFFWALGPISLLKAK